MTGAIKIFGIIMIAFSCSALGFVKSYKMYVHERDLKWYVSALNEIKQKIRYSSAELPEIMGGIIGCAKYYNISFPFCITLRKSGLDSSDESVILEFFQSVGSGDREAEIARCNNYMKEMDFRRQIAYELMRDKAKLCRVLGILCGIAVGIILV